MYTNLENSSLTFLTDGFFYFLLCLLYDFFDSCRMDTAIDDQLFKGNTCYLTAYRIEAGQYDRFRRIIDDQLDTGQLLQCPDVSSFTANDSTLHFIIRQLYNRYGGLCHLVCRAALDGINDIIPANLLTLFLGLVVILADHHRIIMLRILFE